MEKTKINEKDDMVKYENAVLYKIKSPSTDIYYIGATTQQLSKVLYNHKRNYKNYIDLKKNKYNPVYLLVKYPDCYIERIAKCPCEDKQDLNKCLNECISSCDKLCVNRHV